MAFELNAKGKHRELTPLYQGGRYRDGRPKVKAGLLERMKQVTIEEAWGVLGGKGHHFQYTIARTPTSDWKKSYASFKRVETGFQVCSRVTHQSP